MPHSNLSPHPPTAPWVTDRLGVTLFQQSTLLVKLHAEVKAHRVKNLFDLVERFPPEVLRPQHVRLRLLHEFADRANIRVLEAIVGADGELELIDRAVEIFIELNAARLLAVGFGKLGLFLEVDEDLHVILDQLRGQADGVVRLHRAVGPHLDRQLVIIRVLTQAGGLDRVVHLLDGRVNGIDRDVADREILIEVALGGDIAAAALEAHLDRYRPALRDGGDVNVRIEDLDFGVGLDLAGKHFARHRALHAQGLGPGSVQLERNALEVQDYIGRVFHDAGYRRELVQHPFYLDRCNGRAFDRRQQGATQAITDRGAEPTLKRLSVEFAITVRKRFSFAREAFRPLEADHELSFSSVHCFLSKEVRRQNRGAEPPGRGPSILASGLITSN